MYKLCIDRLLTMLCNLFNTSGAHSETCQKRFERISFALSLTLPHIVWADSITKLTTLCLYVWTLLSHQLWLQYSISYLLVDYVSSFTKKELTVTEHLLCYSWNEIVYSTLPWVKWILIIYLITKLDVYEFTY